jgi:hypothetical protein
MISSIALSVLCVANIASISIDTNQKDDGVVTIHIASASCLQDEGNESVMRIEQNITFDSEQ